MKELVEDMSVLIVVKIYILITQVNLYPHVVAAENVSLKKNRVVRE